MRTRSLAIALAATTFAATAPAALAAKGPPPPPTATGGQKVTLLTAGVHTPTSFAYGAGTLFEGDGGAESSKGPPNGGVFAIAGGTASKLPGSPQYVAGLSWHGGSLYVSGATVTGPTSAKWTLQRWSHFNGTAFTRRRVIYTAPKGFQGFNGLAFGPNGRLYVGVDVGLLNQNDHGPATTPYVYDILTFNATGGDMQVFATGIRQPWQFAFAPGSSDPLVSALSQDKGPSRNAPDFVLRVHAGDNYGFPQCGGILQSPACDGFAKPFESFAPHTDIMGLAVIGTRLYMTSFAGVGGRGPGGEVLSMPLSGGKATPVVTGFVAPTVGLGVHGHTLYVGELTGQVFSVTP